jgi:hypothetical protein
LGKNKVNKKENLEMKNVLMLLVLSFICGVAVCDEDLLKMNQKQRDKFFAKQEREKQKWVEDAAKRETERIAKPTGVNMTYDAKTNMTTMNWWCDVKNKENKTVVMDGYMWLRANDNDHPHTLQKLMLANEAVRLTGSVAVTGDFMWGAKSMSAAWAFTYRVANNKEMGIAEPDAPVTTPKHYIKVTAKCAEPVYLDVDTAIDVSADPNYTVFSTDPEHPIAIYKEGNKEIVIPTIDPKTAKARMEEKKKEVIKPISRELVVTKGVKEVAGVCVTRVVSAKQAESALKETNK